MYYGVDEHAASKKHENPLDIDATGFKPELYMEKLMKESVLTDLYQQEERMKKDIQELDSNMQYLVYENHAKFIKASETIREMKDDFQRLEDDMDHLSSRMEQITEASNSINSALADRKQEISQLCGVHHLLKKLQFLFELPKRLNKCLEMGFHAQAVRTYTKAHRVLEQYQHMPSFHGIQRDCAAIVGELKTTLRQKLDDEESSTAVITETVDLLLELKESSTDLCQQFLANSKRQLEKDLEAVREAGRPREVEGEEPHMMDVLEYVSLVCSGLLANVSLVIQSCYDMFVRRHMTSDPAQQRIAAEAQQTLTDFVQTLVDSCLQSVQERLQKEARHLDSGQLVRALDKISSKLQAMDRLLPSAGLSQYSKFLVEQVAQVHTECHAQRLKQSFTDALMEVRHSLATSKGTGTTPFQAPSLNEHCTALYATIKSGLESSLAQVKEFIGSTVTFATRAEFREEFCLTRVRSGVVMGFIQFVLDTCMGFTETAGEQGSSSYPPSLVLILSRLVHDMERSTISYLVSYGDEKFPPDEHGPIVATPTTEVLKTAKCIAQTLLNHYVKVQGQVISQMIRKSVETRDWLNTIEPRNVRSVMKRIVEEVTTIDKQVGTLYEEGAKKEQGSEGSRHTYNYHSITQSKGYPYATSAMDSSLLSNIQKLFYERIEVFGTVDFYKLAIVTGIIKIVLKAFLECVRLRTFGKFGLQQMQVDAHYLQIYLWRFVPDEHLVRVLLEQVVSSTIERCVDPVLMERSVVEVICERN